MRIFYIKLANFITLGIIALCTCYFLGNILLNGRYSNEDIYIWGDSQMYRGIDLIEFSKLTNKNIRSAAQHGAGVYDFLVFSENVPLGSSVIISLSKPVQIRRKERDRNMSGIDVGSLAALYRKNYSIKELSLIIKKNIKLARLFRSTNKLYPYSDQISFPISISSYEHIYSSIPEYLENKQSLYIRGIKNLIKMNCNIILIEFPYHPILRDIEGKSDVKEYTEIMKIKVADLFDNFKIETIKLEPSKEIMHDLTHLNEYGASLLTKKLSYRISATNTPTLYLVHE